MHVKPLLLATLPAAPRSYVRGQLTTPQIARWTTNSLSFLSLQTPSEHCCTDRYRRRCAISSAQSPTTSLKSLLVSLNLNCVPLGSACWSLLLKLSRCGPYELLALELAGSASVSAVAGILACVSCFCACDSVVFLLWSM